MRVRLPCLAHLGELLCELSIFDCLTTSPVNQVHLNHLRHRKLEHQHRHRRRGFAQDPGEIAVVAAPATQRCLTQLPRRRQTIQHRL